MVIILHDGSNSTSSISSSTVVERKSSIYDESWVGGIESVADVVFDDGTAEVLSPFEMHWSGCFQKDGCCRGASMKVNQSSH